MNFQCLIPPPRNEQLADDEFTTEEEDVDVAIDEFIRSPQLEEGKPYYPNQKHLNDLIRDLGLTKSNAELLTSRLKQWNLLDDTVQVTEQRKRHRNVNVTLRNVT